MHVTTIINHIEVRIMATLTFTTNNFAMKRLVFLLTVFTFIQLNIFAQSEAAYFHIGDIPASMDTSIKTSKDALSAAGFKVIGEYHPANSENLAVLCYTSSSIEKIALSFKDRGALAATLKVGFKKEGDKVKVSMLNPMYLFYAYLIDGIDKHEDALIKISNEAKNAMKKVGSDFTPFGGALEKKKLQKYHYKVMMPYFDDAEKLKEFSSFKEGLETIQRNLQNGIAETEKVYELIYADKETAVFGVALKNAETGESKFLPIIGDEHVAAMPYEIILQGNTATILPGKYRIALHWPELTMGTFMKIMSTPSDIKDNLEELTK